MADETQVAEATEEVTEEVKAAEPRSEGIGEIPAKFKDLIAEIDRLSVLDLSEFVKVLEDHYGVSAAAPMAVMAGGAAPAGEA